MGMLSPEGSEEGRFTSCSLSEDLSKPNTMYHSSHIYFSLGEVVFAVLSLEEGAVPLGLDGFVAA